MKTIVYLAIGLQICKVSASKIPATEGGLRDFWKDGEIYSRSSYYSLVYFIVHIFIRTSFMYSPASNLADWDDFIFLLKLGSSSVLGEHFSSNGGLEVGRFYDYGW